MRPSFAILLLICLAWSSRHEAYCASWDSQPWPAETHWYETSSPPGLEIFTKEKLPWMASDGLGLRYTGPLKAKLAADLRELLLATPQRFNHVVLELDSDGGDLTDVRAIASVLREASNRMEITTRVMEGSLCASGCIALFMQGGTRKASGASIWVFHGARRASSTLPDPEATDLYLDMLSASGMSKTFHDLLTANNRIYRPGSLILSGYELFAVNKAGIITELLPSWREPLPPQPSGLIPR